MRALGIFLVIWLVALFLKGFHPPAPKQRPSVETPLPPVVSSPEPVTPAPELAKEPDIQVTFPSDGGKVAKRFQWQNLGIKDRALQTGQVQIDIPIDEMNRQIAAFGVPAEWMQYRYQRGNLERIQRQRTQVFAQRGILRNQGALTPDYRWMIRQSRSSLHPVTRALIDSFRKKKGKNARDLLSYMSGMVQHLQYRIPDDMRSLPWNPNRSVCTAGVHMPLETLYQGWGDCDSKSVLLAALFSNLGKTSTVFVQGNDHVFIGVAGIPRRNDHYITHKNIKYILIETTRPWPLGKIPSENWHAMRSKRFRVYEVY